MFSELHAQTGNCTIMEAGVEDMCFGGFAMVGICQGARAEIQ